MVVRFFTLTFLQVKVYLAMLDNVIKQLPTRNILHHHEDICWCANNLIPAKKMLKIYFSKFPGKIDVYHAVYIYLLTHRNEHTQMHKHAHSFKLNIVLISDFSTNNTKDLFTDSTLKNHFRLKNEECDIPK